MNKKVFIGFSVVIDLIVLILIIAAAAEMGKNKNKGSGKESTVAEMTEESSEDSSKKEKSSSSERKSGKDDSSSTEESGESSSKADDSTESSSGENTPAGEETPAANTPAETTSAVTVTPAGSTGSASLTVTVRFDGMDVNSNAVQGIFDVKNNGSAISLSELTTGFFLTSEGKGLVFECYHAAINTSAGAYQALSGVSGGFESATGQNTDTKLTIKYGDGLTLNTGDTMTVNFSIHSGDWSNLITNNDWSTEGAEHIVFYKAGAVIAGTEPN